MAKGLGSWSRAPLVLAVAELVFDQRARFAEEADELGKLQQSGDYPRFSQGQLNGFVLSQRPGQVQFEQQTIPFRTFNNAAGTVAFRLMPERLSFFDADYSGDFDGFLGRFLHVYGVWKAAAPALALRQASVRMLDVVMPIDERDLAEWLEPEWRAGRAHGAKSVGLVIRDSVLDDGSIHVRLRDAVLEKNQALAPPADLMAGAPVSLSKDLMGPFDKDIRHAWVDTERVVALNTNDEAVIKAALGNAHTELAVAFKAVFKQEAIAYFRGDEEKTAHVKS